MCFQVGASIVPNVFREVFGEEELSNCENFLNTSKVPGLSRFTFFGTVAAPSHVHIFRYSDAAWED